MNTVRVPALVIAALLLVACGGGVISPYQSNGERIYFTATNEQGEGITYTGGPTYGGMMGMMNAPRPRGWKRPASLS